MRVAFVNTLFDLAKKDKNILLLTGDLGYSVLESYMEELPRQFLNMGVAEQNMAGVAAGMAMEEKTPFIYSIVPFTTMRNFEQIRNDICYQNLNVKIVGTGAGFSYGPYGHTHHGLEDVGILRTLPNLTIFSPADPIETAFVTKKAVAIKGPVYIRLGKAGEPKVHSGKPRLVIGKGTIITDGEDIALLATGTMVYRALQVSEKLYKLGLRAQVISIHTIKPFDTKLVLNLVKKTKPIFTLEEHSIIGGLGSAVAEVLAENGLSTIFRRIGVLDRFTKVIGNQEYMRRANGLSVGQIKKTILASLRLWKKI